MSTSKNSQFRYHKKMVRFVQIHDQIFFESITRGFAVYVPCQLQCQMLCMDVGGAERN
jgi:hypothetical protein